MAINVERFGETPEGIQVDLYTLTNENGVRASFTNLGGTWVSMMVPDKHGVFADVVLGYDTVEHYRQNPPHFGAVIGRNANRIGGASFSLNGKVYPLTANDGSNNLHSGLDYYRTRIWEVELGEDSEGSRVSFSLFSPNGDQGFPGNLDVTVSYTLTPDNGIRIEYKMISDEDTIANFTNHSYFNLAGHHQGNISHHQVWIDADFFTPTDEFSIPYGNLASVKGTPMDFTVMKEIGRDIDADFDQLVKAKGYDHNWVLNHEPGKLALCAKAYEPVSGRTMKVYTDLPGMQFYTANGMESPFPGKDGVLYLPRMAYCFETQYYPDAANQSQFPSPVIKAGKEYRTVTVYQFSDAD